MLEIARKYVMPLVGCSQYCTGTPAVGNNIQYTVTPGNDLWCALLNSSLHYEVLKYAVLTKTKKFDHISPLGWLSIKDQLLMRDATQMYKIVNGLVLSYLCN